MLSTGSFVLYVERNIQIKINKNKVPINPSLCSIVRLDINMENMKKKLGSIVRMRINENFSLHRNNKKAIKMVRTKFITKRIIGYGLIISIHLPKRNTSDDVFTSILSEKK
jgi:hypothetical protein